VRRNREKQTIPSKPSPISVWLDGSGTVPTLKLMGRLIVWPGASDSSNAPSSVIAPNAGALVDKTTASKSPTGITNGYVTDAGELNITAASAAVSPLSVPETSTLNGVLTLTRLSPSEKVPTSPVQAESESQATVPVTEPSVLVKLVDKLEENGEGSAVKLKLVIEEADALAARNPMDARKTKDFFAGIFISELGRCSVVQD